MLNNGCAGLWGTISIKFNRLYFYEFDIAVPPLFLISLQINLCLLKQTLNFANFIR